MVAYRKERTYKPLNKKERKIIKEKEKHKKYIKLVFCILFILALLFFNPKLVLNLYKTKSFKLDINSSIKGKVTGIRKEEYTYDNNSKDACKGIQDLDVEILKGKYKGEIISINNNYDEKNPYSFKVKKGDKIFLTIDEKSQGGLKSAYIYSFDREEYICYLSIIFIVSLLLIGRKAGLKTLVIALILVPIMLKFLPRLLYLKYNYLCIMLIISLIIIFSMAMLFCGINKKTLATILGSLGGVLVCAITVLGFQKACKFSGVTSEDAQMLMYNGNSLDFKALIFISIIIGSIGVIFQTSLCITENMDKIKNSNPKIRLLDLIKQGLQSGREHLGSSSNTLLFAYIGASLQSIIVFILSNNLSFRQGLNQENVILELLRIASGILGLLWAIPITVLIYTLITGVAASREN